MKTVSNDYKTNIKKYGKQIDSIISYNIDGTDYTLDKSQLNTVTPSYEGGILKSVMKQLIIDSNVEIPLETIVNYQFGVLVGNSYEYIDYGNYIVYKVEKKEDTNSYEITCYDKMLYAMKDYESLEITYPITIRNYINVLCNRLGLTFKNSNETFANYDKQILNELYLDSNGNSLSYTYRDILDELAQVTASTIVINNQDKLEIKYISKAKKTKNLLDTSQFVNGYYSGSRYIESQEFAMFGKISIKENKYTFSTNANVRFLKVSYFNDNDENVGELSTTNRDYLIIQNIPSTATYFRVAICKNLETTMTSQVIDSLELMVEVGNERTDYVPYVYIETIDEKSLKDINVSFGEKYGPINSIVLSRADSDNIYLQDEDSVEENGLCEIKIQDNQIMNGNDRDEYLPDILEELDGLEYYLNDYSSTGITYLELCDRYDIEIGDNEYSCVMFNNELNITQGLEENIHTDLPEESETDYTKADKTDRRLNQTTLIVDKQNQTIQSVVSTVSEQNQTISQINQTVNEINTKISDISDITISGESNYANVSLDNVNASQPISIKIYPIGESISYLYPHNALYPSSTLYPKNRILRFYNKKEYQETTDTKYTSYKKYYSYDGTTYTLLVAGTDYIVGSTITGTIYENKYYDWELPTNLWYLNSDTYDDIELSYGDGTDPIVIVNRRCQINSSGVVSALATATTETYPYPTDLNLTDGDYDIVMLGYSNGYLFVQLMASNIYTTQFATKVEMNSAITQTANNIMLEVNEKVNEDEIIAKINLAVENDQGIINLVGNTVTIDSDNFKLDAYGNITCQDAIMDDTVMNTATINDATMYNVKVNKGNIKLESTPGHIDPSTGQWVGPEVIEIVNSTDPTNKYMYLSSGQINIYNENNSQTSHAQIQGHQISLNEGSAYMTLSSTINSGIQITDGSGGLITYLKYNESQVNGNSRATGFVNISEEKAKKNIEKAEKGLDILKNIDIYSYNYNDEKKSAKKHYGTVIGEKYKYAKEITNDKNDGVDLYSFISICCKSIQEQQEQIEELKKQIKSLKGGK